MVSLEYLWNIYNSVNLIYWSPDQALTIKRWYIYEMNNYGCLEILEKFGPETQNGRGTFTFIPIQKTALRLT